jgi:hypothetical protein
MKLILNSLSSGLLILVTLLGGSANAETISWANWTTVGGGAEASITLPNSGPTVNVLYQGLVGGVFPSGFFPSTAYINPGVVDNTPGPNALYLSGSPEVNTINFSEIVLNPYIAVFSLGTMYQAATMEFDALFDVVSGGAGPYGGYAPQELANNVLYGVEGNGVIQFSGSFSSISFVFPTQESSVWTLGVSQVAAAVPEPSTYALLALGLIGAGFYRRRNKNLN